MKFIHNHTKKAGSLSIALLLIFIGLLVKSCSYVSGENKAHPELTPHFNTSWANDKLWDDGKAEVVVYDAERIIYGRPRRFEYVFILVKETFNAEHRVKTDDYKRSDLYEVMKVNKFAGIETDNYPYHFLSSLFFMRDNSTLLHKATISSQEWCGNTFKSFKRQDDNFSYDYNSYWDNQGEGSIKFQNTTMFEDQLSYSLRSLNFKDSLIFQYPVLESQINNKANKPVEYNASFFVQETRLDGDDSWLVVVQLDHEKINRYWFKKEYPNILVKQTTWDGRNLNLKSIKRDAYWQGG